MVLARCDTAVSAISLIGLIAFFAIAPLASAQELSIHAARTVDIVSRLLENDRSRDLRVMRTPRSGSDIRLSPASPDVQQPSDPEESPERNIFETGALTFRFDDGWDEHYSFAAPTLEHEGFRGTFYITSGQTENNLFFGFMSEDEIEELSSRGHEIGAHTRTHPDLTTLPMSEQRAEIAGSRADILALDTGPVLSFAYPYGRYTSDTVRVVKEAGFTSAAAGIMGNVRSDSDAFQLEQHLIEAGTSLSQMRAWVDDAKERREWAVITIHRIDENSSDIHNMTPADFEALVRYVKEQGLPVITISEGIRSLR